MGPASATTLPPVVCNPATPVSLSSWLPTLIGSVTGAGSIVIDRSAVRAWVVELYWNRLAAGAWNGASALKAVARPCTESGAWVLVRASVRSGELSLSSSNSAV